MAVEKGRDLDPAPLENNSIVADEVCTLLYRRLDTGTRICSAARVEEDSKIVVNWQRISEKELAGRLQRFC
jgi:hypothetical protein